ncbi:MAG: flagellar basal body protein FliL [Gammaproteobacteria bacterium]|nr:MAG: flagellar basal body protein FliL [Gammaproteobacteria bacterium]
MAEKEVELAEGQGGSNKKLLLIALGGAVVLSAVIVAVLVMTGVLGGKGGDAAAEEGKGGAQQVAEAKKKSRAPLLYQPVEPPFVVSFSTDSDVRFMQIKLQVADRDPAVIERVKNNLPAIRNSLILLFSSQKPEALMTREGKEKLRKAALEEVRKVLREQTGEGTLENLFFTSFVMQ